MIVEALESAMGYAKRAKLVVLKHTRGEIDQERPPATSGRRRKAQNISDEEPPRPSPLPLADQS